MPITKTDGATKIKGGLAPDFVTIYDGEGNAFKKFPIDARECVESGSFYYEKPEPKEDDAEEEAVTDEAEAAEPAEEEEEEDLESMTKSELMALADERELTYKTNATKAQLVALLSGGDE